MGEIEVVKEDVEFLRDAAENVKEVLTENEWKYSYEEVRPDLGKFELGFGVKNGRISVKVFVETDPKVCRIDAIYPFRADPTYDYLLSYKFLKENYPRRYGALQYDDRDGEVSYRYSYSIEHGLYKDDFFRIFLAVLRSASDSHDMVRKYCVGKLKTKEIEEVLGKLDALVNDLSDDEE